MGGVTSALKPWSRTRGNQYPAYREKNFASRAATTFQSMLMVFRSITLAAALGLAVGIVGCSKRESPVEEGIRTQTLLLGNSAEPADLDPQVVTAYTDANILNALFEGLTGLDEKTSQGVP